MCFFSICVRFFSCFEEKPWFCFLCIFYHITECESFYWCLMCSRAFFLSLWILTNIEGWPKGCNSNMFKKQFKLKTMIIFLVFLWKTRRACSRLFFFCRFFCHVGFVHLGKIVWNWDECVGKFRHFFVFTNQKKQRNVPRMFFWSWSIFLQRDWINWRSPYSCSFYTFPAETSWKNGHK